MSRLVTILLAVVGAALVYSEPAQATSSGSNGRIAFWKGSSTDTGRSGIYTIRPDGTGLRRLTSSWDTLPAWSPDGRRIAFVRDLKIWLMRGSGRYQHPVTSSPSWNIEPTFSRDGGTIAFISNRTGSWNIFELASRQPYRHARQISNVSRSDAWAKYPSFAPDGSLYWVEGSASVYPFSTVMRLAADGSPPTAVDQCFSCWELDVAPNGQSLLWSINSDPDGVDCGQLGRYNLITATLTNIRDCVEGQGLSDASFSPDGKRLVSNWFDGDGATLVTTDRAGRHRQRIPHTRHAGGAAWQPIH